MVLPGTLNSYAAKSLINTTPDLSPRASLIWQKSPTGRRSPL
jgi:hypothetical protein